MKLASNIKVENNIPIDLSADARYLRDENGNFVEGQIISTYQVKGSGPKIDPKNRALQKIIELTESDFPDTPLSFTSKGIITRKK